MNLLRSAPIILVGRVNARVQQGENNDDEGGGQTRAPSHAQIKAAVRRFKHFDKEHGASAIAMSELIPDSLGAIGRSLEALGASTPTPAALKRSRMNRIRTIKGETRGNFSDLVQLHDDGSNASNGVLGTLV